MTDMVFAVEFLDGGGVEIPASGTELSLLPTLFVDNGEAFDYKKYTVVGDCAGRCGSVRAPHFDDRRHGQSGWRRSGDCR